MNKKLGEYALDINGTKVNLLFSMSFWMKLDELGLKMEDLATQLAPEKGVLNIVRTLSKIVWAAGSSYARKNKQDFDYEIEDVQDWFSELDEKVMEEIMEAMTSTKIFGHSMNQGLDRMGKGNPKKVK